MQRIEWPTARYPQAISGLCSTIECTEAANVWLGLSPAPKNTTMRCSIFSRMLGISRIGSRRDSTLPITVRSNVEADVARQLFLCAAADIANGSKHLELDTSRAGTVITERRVNLYIEEDPVRAGHEHSIKGERQHDRC
jgi:hypothetical protein